MGPVVSFVQLEFVRWAIRLTLLCGVGGVVGGVIDPK